jgi:hypothetical protein
MLDQPWVLERVALLLPPRDVVNLSMASRRCPRLVRRLVPWTEGAPTTTQVRYDNPNGPDHPERYDAFRAAPIPPVVPPAGHCAHSMTLAAFWRDQGWGYAKGGCSPSSPSAHGRPSS